MTRRRSQDSPSYNPDSDRSGWNQLDTGLQRFIAIASAFGILVGVCAWTANTVHIAERVTKLESETAEAKSLASANLAVTCILARKVDPSVEPKECRGR